MPHYSTLIGMPYGQTPTHSVADGGTHTLIGGGPPTYLHAQVILIALAGA